MAIEYIVKQYGCKFKCDRKHTREKRWMEEHEENCWYNPKNHTCMTCKHGGIEYTFSNKEVRGCDILQGHELLKKQRKNIQEDKESIINSPFGDIKQSKYSDFQRENFWKIPIVNCEFWEGK